MDDNNRTSDTDQLLIVFRGITESLDVVKETLNVCKGQQKILCVCVCVCVCVRERERESENIKEHEVPWTKLKVTTSNRTSSMIRNTFDG
jgi:hypothetical protein